MRREGEHGDLGLYSAAADGIVPLTEGMFLRDGVFGRELDGNAANPKRNAPMIRLDRPNLGLGVGFRTAHFGYILRHRPKVDWFEVVTENFLDTGGRPLWILDQVAERYPIVLHGVSMSVGSPDPVDWTFLGKVKALARRVRAIWVSDHLCWTGVAGRNLHDLLPLPYTEETLRHVVRRIREIQDFLERPLILENPSSYVEFKSSTLPEWEFIARMAKEADCGILLDVNNIYVSAFNHGFDPEAYVRAIPPDRVAYYHVAGHTNLGSHILDTHIGPVIDPVWRLLGLAHRLSGGRSTLLEWDEQVPSFPVVHREAMKARKYMEETLVTA